MGLVNTITLEGIISEHLDIRYFGYEHLRVKFRLHTVEKGLKVDGADWEQWHNIELSNAIAKEAEEQLKKGDKISLEGRIAYHKELDNDGRKRYITVIHVRSFTLLDKAQQEQEEEVIEEPKAKDDDLEWGSFSVSSDEDPMA